MSFAVRNIPRADREVIARLAAAGTATVHEAQGRGGLLQPYMRPIQAGAAIGGSAVTVLAHPGDNWMLHVAIELCQPGDVMVVACSAPNTDGMFGELLATSMRARGIVGLVIDAGCRDVQALKDMGFPVWSKAVSAKGTIKATPGSVNLPVVCAGAMVSAGDVVVADDDGVVIVPRRRAGEVAQACDARLQKEALNRKRLAAGELGLDIYGMRDKLREAGLVYVDSEADLP
ncbi:4-carboxy-4-hydroxy-2-oxoadipate aldolase/oxaloacetate decarboxylase [Bordetella bronchialis]|uniref:4-hydroxy-4-methyl-2-oxoglutarate aldolase n=1 Tax=Bordetella bronchialis TaxID=463025 RepID=A0A193FW32_9BORD|nr:4-carboxy-4-hydroxy-2-oxoadipate aldolase/oxaloacetate decarboxylase [Bordetella bronchialis]ANN66896.1 4-carboxy-4-hydroxy-2-oxoadipate aldolase/oxaloacetate decarboxylase [Bordetella bronchialis]ANN71972.1 4-carboxy-4-hydroxy-2-oxoadipate aldolase/oxaloacetate decarboxylase [Bordetella bronchialis]